MIPGFVNSLIQAEAWIQEYLFNRPEGQKIARSSKTTSQAREFQRSDLLKSDVPSEGKTDYFNKIIFSVAVYSLVSNV